MSRRTFAGRLGEKGWVKRFTRHGASGAYLRVIVPGEIRSGDPIEIVHRPEHDVTVAMAFRAETTERTLLPRVLVAGEALHAELLKDAREYVAKYGQAPQPDPVSGRAAQGTPQGTP